MLKQQGIFQPLIGIFLIVFAVLIGGFVLFQRNSGRNLSAFQATKISKPSPTSRTSQFQTLTFTSFNLNDPDSTFYFGDAKSVYQSKLDGLPPKELATFSQNISAVDLLKDGDIGVITNNDKYEKVVNKGPQDPDYKQVSIDSHDFVLSNGNKQEMTDDKFQSLIRQNASPDGRYYTKELSNGQAEIWLDKLNGEPPEKIGLLKEKPLNIQVCEVGDCMQKMYPTEFLPSFDGSYLINKSPNGGGLGVPAVVFSKDGSRVYKIDFYWYVSSAAWIGNDQLLTKGQDGEQFIYTFNEDGKFTKTPFDVAIGDYFSQANLSPDKQYLIIYSDDPAQISFLDLTNKKLTIVEKEDRQKLIEQYNFQQAVQIDPRISHLYNFLGWNKKGDKFAYAEQIDPFKELAKTFSSEIRLIKVYDVKSGKIYTVSKLNPHPINPDEYLIEGKPVSNVSIFAFN